MSCHGSQGHGPWPSSLRSRLWCATRMGCHPLADRLPHRPRLHVHHGETSGASGGFFRAGGAVAALCHPPHLSSLWCFGDWSGAGQGRAGQGGVGSALCSDREPGSGVNRLRLRSKSEIGSLRHPLGKSLLVCGTVCSTLRPHRSKSWPVSVTNTSARVLRALAPPAARRALAGARGASSSVLFQSSRYREVRILPLTPPGSRLSGREGLSGCRGGTRETGRPEKGPQSRAVAWRGGMWHHGRREGWGGGIPRGQLSGCT